MNVQDSVKIAKALRLARITNGRFISSARQLANDTYAFEFDAMPEKRYMIYADGTVRCQTDSSRPCSFGPHITPIIWEKSTKDALGRREKKIKKVSFDQAIAYFQKRFEVNL